MNPSVKVSPLRSSRLFLRKALFSFALASIVLASTAGGTTSLEQKATELAQLRSALDLMESDLRAERSRGQAALRTLEGRRATLSMQLDAERVRAETARKKLLDLQEQVDVRKSKSQGYLPVLEKAADDLSHLVRKGLPFHVEERLQAIEDVKVRAKTGRLDPETACSRLWQLIEDEIRLTGEVARTKIPLAFDQERVHSTSSEHPRQLLDVVRIGMVTLFIRHAPGQFSRLVRKDGAWRAEPIRDVRHIKQLENLFDNVSKQVLQGDYALPLPPVKPDELVEEISP